MTLSHCWGKIKFFTLVNENLSDLRESIPCDKLTKTHREAIELTRILGVKYLWIDSLCIIQDSKDDWAFESARMMNVYSNSHCNIAATGAADGNCGLFFERNLDDLDPIIFKLPRKDIASSMDIPSIRLVQTVFQHMKMTTAGNKEYTPGIFEVFYFTDSDVWRHGVPQSPLGQRAWCLQERILSPRTIHFGENQLFFECQSLHACSRFPDGIPPILIPSLESKSNSSLIDAAKTARPEDNFSRERAYEIWSNIVRIYSACNLTFGKDKLVAVSGMASFIESKLYLSGYLAGTWAYGVLEQLLWSYDMEDSPDEPFGRYRPKTYRAPSWSWASVDHAIKFFTPVRMPLAKVTQGRTWLKIEENKYGEVEYGMLVLDGVLIPSKTGTYRKQFSLSLSGFVSVLQLGGTDAVLEPSFDDWHDGRHSNNMCVPLAFTNSGVIGLVLLEAEQPRVTTDGMPIYRRAGFFHAVKDVWSKFRGRPVKQQYTLERTPSGSLVQCWPNVPPKEPNFDREDKEWTEQNSMSFVLV
jgi:hypothetical protein